MEAILRVDDIQPAPPSRVKHVLIRRPLASAKTSAAASICMATQDRQLDAAVA
jgi:hypothetical protein